jgi:hypothetical protein
MTHHPGEKEGRMARALAVSVIGFAVALPPSAVGCPPGAQFSSDLTIAYPKGAPPWITPGTTWADGTDFVTIDGMPAVHFSDLTPSCRPR